MTIATIRRIKIRIHLLLVAMIGIFAISGQLTEAIVSLASVIFHEWCHAVVALKLKWCVKEIELLPFGGVAKMERICAGGLDEIFIVIAGPVGSAVAGGICYMMNESGILSMLAEVNLMLALCNLIPAYPLDGGRILHSVLHHMMKPKEAIRRTVRISQLVASVLLFYAGYSLVCDGEVLISLLMLAGMTWRMTTVEYLHSALLPFAIMATKRRMLLANGYLKMQWYVVAGEKEVREVIELFRSDMYTMVAVLDRAGQYQGEISEMEVWQLVERHKLTEPIEKFCSQNK